MKNLLLLLLICSLYSCTSVNKLFHKTKSRTDSTGHMEQVIDSTDKKDSSYLHKENKITLVRTDSSKEKENTVTHEEITEKEFNDSGKLKKETVIRRTIESGKQKEAASTTVLDNHSQIDAGDVKQEGVKHEAKTSDTKVVSKNKDVVKTVHKTKFWWWLLLIVPAYLIYRNWPKIKAFGIHLMTGL